MTLEQDQVATGDTVKLKYAPNWDGQAVVTHVSHDAVRLRMTTGTYAGAEGSFAWRDSNEWAIRKVQSK